MLSANGSAGSRAVPYSYGNMRDDSLLGDPWPEEVAVCKRLETNAYCDWIGVTCCCWDDAEVDEELGKCEWCQAVNGSMRGSVSALSFRGLGLQVGAAAPLLLPRLQGWLLPAAPPGVRRCRPARQSSALPRAAPAGQNSPDL